MESRTFAIICDIDGTLANIDHRRHFVEGNEKDWKSFNEHIFNDSVNKWCKLIIQSIWSTGIQIIFVSGRKENFRDITCNQVSKWLDIFGFVLHMRANDDFRTDKELKKEIYEKSIAPSFNIIFAIDDRKCIVDLWRSLGITTLDCAGYEK